MSEAGLKSLYEREVRDRRRTTIYGMLLVIAAATVFGAILWTYH
jgi:hypothetical protein